MITYFVNKDNIEDNASIQLENLSNDKNISDVVVFPDIHYASNKSIPVGVAFKSDKIYPLVSGKDTGCGVGYMTISKKNIIKQFDKDKYYKALFYECSYNNFSKTNLNKEHIMAKGRDSQKSEKKVSTKSLKEKRQEKKDKKANKR